MSCRFVPLADAIRHLPTDPRLPACDKLHLADVQAYRQGQVVLDVFVAKLQHAASCRGAQDAGLMHHPAPHAQLPGLLARIWALPAGLVVSRVADAPTPLRDAELGLAALAPQSGASESFVARGWSRIAGLVAWLQGT